MATHIKIVTKNSVLKSEIVSLLATFGIECCKCNDGVIAQMSFKDLVVEAIKQCNNPKISKLEIRDI